MHLHMTDATQTGAPGTALRLLLDEFDHLLAAIDPASYTARIVPGVSGSVGEHVRHCLDHVSALLAANPSVTLSYDHRQRGTNVETDVSAARALIRDCKRALDGWTRRSLDQPIRVSSIIAAGEAVTGWSTFGRELAFVISHTIHHQALIAVLLAIDGHGVRERFGYAPSTPRSH